MTVKELREMLKNVNADAEVFCTHGVDLNEGNEATDVIYQHNANEVTIVMPTG